MRLTDRDVRLVRDVALSHLLSRDQLLALGYFNSVTRANTRTRELVAGRYLQRLTTPFFGQSLYSAGPVAVEIVGERIGSVLRERAESPRFVRHALALSDVRIALLAKGGTGWRFEQQLWREISDRMLKPDGMVITKSLPAFVEVDLANVSAIKFKEKLATYNDLAKGDLCLSLYGFERFRVMAVTTSVSRARHLESLLPAHAGYEFRASTFESLGIRTVGAWS